MPQYYTQQELKSRGWTAVSLKILLASPDLTKPNPQNRKHPIKLFETARVHTVERSPVFLKQSGRSQQAKAKSKQKRQSADNQARSLIQTLPIAVPDINLPVLRDIAVKRVTANFHAVNAEGDPDLSEATVREAMVVYLSELSTPQLPVALQVDAFGTVLGQLQDRINAAIAVKYPSLKSHCQ